MGRKETPVGQAASQESGKRAGDEPGSVIPEAPKRPKRPRELQDSLNFHLYHPLAWQLARLLAKTPITPNVVSVIGGSFVVAAGIVYALTFNHGRIKLKRQVCVERPSYSTIGGSHADNVQSH